MKRGARQQRFGGQDGRIEALQVPDLQHAAVAPRGVDQLLRLRRGLGDRLFDQHVRAVLRGNRARSRQCVGVGCDDADRVDLAEQLPIVAASARCRVRSPPRRAASGSASTTPTSSQSPSCRILLGVEAPEIAHADDGRSDFLHAAGYYA